MTPEQENLESRKTTMNRLFQQMTDALSVLPPDMAVIYTDPICDMLLGSVRRL